MLALSVIKALKGGSKLMCNCAFGLRGIHHSIVHMH